MVKTLLSETITSIGTLGGIIAAESHAKRKQMGQKVIHPLLYMYHSLQERQTFSIQFAFVLHGAMEIVSDPSNKMNTDWKAHFKSREVWTAAKLYARDSTPEVICH